MNNSGFPRLLINLGANLHEWGKGEAGTMDELNTRIETGWASIDEENHVLLSTSLHIDILYGTHCRELLVEEERILLDSETPHPSFKCSSHSPVISCPIRMEEETAHFGIITSKFLRSRFKFKIGYDVKIDYVDMRTTAPWQSRRYPGLSEVRKVKRVEYDMPVMLYEPNGYTWRRDEWITRYQWMPIVRNVER